MQKNKHIAILGAGESGVGAAILATKQGYSVWVSDKGKIKPNYKKELEKRNIKWEEGKHTESKILNATIIVKSPGIPDTAPLVLKLRKKGIPVISEIEFAGKYSNAQFIGITGSNGKTTTSLLTYHILKKANLNVGLAGNIGDSLAKQVAENDKDIYVLELSSFQLDGMFDFKVDIAIILNITPDHLDRYDNKFENYADSKMRILQNQTKKDHFIFWSDDTTIKEYIKKNKYNATLHPFSLNTETENGAYTKGNKLYIINKTNTLFEMTIQELALQGKHNLYNTMAAGVASKILNLKKESVRESLSDFQNAEHRLENVGKVHGITFINDSKATNINSTWYALESFPNPIVWIVGGVDKGNDYEMLRELVTDKVKAIVCLGENNSKIHEAFKDIVPNIVNTSSAEDAVQMAYRFSEKDDTVLLSPACASFDLFDSYEDRGHQFKAAVRKL